MIQVIQPSGILNGSQAEYLQQAIDNVLQTGSEAVLVDFKDVTFIDSSGLGALVMVLKAVRTSGGQLYFCSIGEQARMLFEITGTDQVFNIYANRDEFHQAFLSPTQV